MNPTDESGVGLRVGQNYEEEHSASRKPRPVPQPARKTRWWLWLLILPLAYLGWETRSRWLPWIETLMVHRSESLTPSGPRVVPVVAVEVKQRDLNVYLNGLGTVTAYKTVTLRSRVEGELINVTFDEGQMVKEGDLLAEIDPRPYQVQLDQAQGQLTRDEATLKGAKLTLERYKSLLPSNTVTPQQVDEQEALVKQAEGTIQSDLGIVNNSKLQLSYCRILAPISGRIGLRLVDKGNIVRANDANGLAIITQLQPIAVVFPIPQDEIPRVQKRMREVNHVEVFAFDRSLKQKIAAGKLEAIDNQVDPTTGTLKLKGVFDNEDNALFPNQFVNARLLVDQIKDAVIIPSAAIQRGPDFSFVYVIRDDETVELRKVDLGPTEGAETSIRSGLVPGELVATEGLDKLQPGAKVSTKEKNGSSDLPTAPSKSEDGSKGAR